MKIDYVLRNSTRQSSEVDIVTIIMTDLGMSMTEAFDYWYSTRIYELFAGDEGYPCSVLRDGPLAIVDSVYREKEMECIKE